MFQKKKVPKAGGAQTLSSGNPASEPSDMTPVPEAAFVMDEEVQSLVDGYEGLGETKGEKAVVSIVNNSTLILATLNNSLKNLWTE